MATDTAPQVPPDRASLLKSRLARIAKLIERFSAIGTAIIESYHMPDYFSAGHALDEDDHWMALVALNALAPITADLHDEIIAYAELLGMDMDFGADDDDDCAPAQASSGQCLHDCATAQAASGQCLHDCAPAQAASGQCPDDCATAQASSGQCLDVAPGEA